MNFIKVIGMFDEHNSLERAKHELVQSGMPNEGRIRVEPEELVEEQGTCFDKGAVIGAARHLQESGEDSDPHRNVLLFDEETGRFIGRISEDELRVLRDALEEEDPDDNDYWINDDEIDELACRRGATPHLIALLRSAVRGRPDGIDLVFERAGMPRQGLRKAAAADQRR